MLAAVLVVLFLAATAPLTVGATVPDGDRAVARSAAIAFSFNQDMNLASVRQGISIDPVTPFSLQPVDGRHFLFKPQLQPDTTYHVQLRGLQKAIGFGQLTYAFSFHTEAAPRVTGLSLDGATLAEGQGAVPLRGMVAITFSQPMDRAGVPILVDGSLVAAGDVRWDATATTASFPVSLGHSRPHTISVPQQAQNRRHDSLVAEWKVGFSTMVQVPSAGSTVRIGTAYGPVIIQIENSGQPTVRPQSGMQQADMIYEYISEYGIPRLTAVYWHPPTSLIGPVRSCRLITIQLEQMYHGMIFCSGANDFVLGQVWKYPNIVYDYAYWLPIMFRANDRVAPHNVMARAAEVTQRAAAALGSPPYDVAPAHPDAALAGATPAATITVPQHGTVWRYNPDAKEYFKWQDGAPFTNVGTGQVHAKNVIVEHVPSRIDTTPGNFFHHYYTEYYELAGEGSADIYSDGGVIHATWRHPDRTMPVVYNGPDGNPVDLNTGLTWVHVIGSDQ
jgi:hypothetical protein